MSDPAFDPLAGLRAFVDHGGEVRADRGLRRRAPRVTGDDGMNTGGTGAVRLTTKAKDDVFPVWSRSGLRIAFQGLDSDNDWEIYLVSATGGALTKLTNNAKTDVTLGW